MFDFYKDKTVLVTGHTGFKGAWLTRMLVNAGAKVVGYSLAPDTDPSLFTLAQIEKDIVHVEGDIRDLDHLKAVFEEYRPEIVFHLAAQPIVLRGYSEPVYTYETNVMGTVNVMECIRTTPGIKSVVIITTDKVYENADQNKAFTETDRLNGTDPYSNSKSCAELVVSCYRRSYLNNMDIPVSTVRAGNVIGGGDFAPNRIIPDCIKAANAGETIVIRNPRSIRPYQHVLEPLFAYLLLAEMQFCNHRLCGNYNIGPEYCDCVTTNELVRLFCGCYGNATYTVRVNPDAPHEAQFLRLDNSKIKRTLGWTPKWHVDRAIKEICRFNQVMLENGNVAEEMDREIREFGDCRQ